MFHGNDNTMRRFSHITSYLALFAGLIVGTSTPSDAGETLVLGRIKSAGVLLYGNPKTYSVAVRDLYPVDLDGDGNEEVIFAGFESQPNKPAKYDNTRLQIFGWSNGRLVNQTTQWLPSGAEMIEGTNDIAFGDFNGDRKIDFFTTAYTDMDHQVYEYGFTNKGGYFERQQFSMSSQQHGVTAGDFNGDGYGDVVVDGYLSAPYFLGGPNGLTRYMPGGYHYGSDISAGHFLTPDELSFVEVDGYAYGVNDTDTLLLRATPNDDHTNFSFDYVSPLPAGRYGPIGHDVRALPFKLNDDNLDDVVIFSRERGPNNTWTKDSRVQLLINQGDGAFTDVTDTKLVGYTTNTDVSYHPVVTDINRDGLPDIFVSGSNWSRRYNSTAILMGRPGGVLAERFRAQLSAVVRKPGVISTLVKTNGGFFVVYEHHWKGRGTVKYAPIAVE